MTERTKGSEMTQSEILREMRQDIRDLHNKIDDNNKDNNKSHTDFQKQLSAVDKNSSINTVKLGGFVTLISLVVAGVVNYSIYVVTG